jgi:hypothetical protein
LLSEAEIRLFTLKQIEKGPALPPIAAPAPRILVRTIARLEAIFGWQGGTMASLYTRAADWRLLAMEAISLFDFDFGLHRKEAANWGGLETDNAQVETANPQHRNWRCS